MISKKDILNIAHHVVRRDQGIPDRQIMHPTREWIWGLAIASAAFLGGSVYAGFLFFHQFELFDRIVSVDTTITSYDEVRVKEVLQKYRHKTTQFNVLREEQGIPIVVEDVAALITPVTATTTSTESAGPIILE